jgi:hypothetical protein
MKFQIALWIGSIIISPAVMADSSLRTSKERHLLSDGADPTNPGDNSMIAALQQQLTALQGKINTLEATVAGLQGGGDLTALQNLVAALQNNDSAQDSDINNLQAAVGEKADADDLLELSNVVDTLSITVGDKADADDLRALSDAVDTLSITVDDKADAGDLLALSDIVGVLSNTVDDKAGKDYVDGTFATKTALALKANQSLVVAIKNCFAPPNNANQAASCVNLLDLNNF